MNIRSAIRDILLNSTLVSALTTTIRPGVLKQADNPPCILVKVITNEPNEYLNTRDRIYKARVAVQAYGKTADDADKLSERINQTLHPLFKGEYSGVKIQEVSLESGPFDDEDQPKDGSDAWLRHSRQDFSVVYSIL